jgi:hypothetical protein
VGTASTAEAKTTLLTLWRGLAETCRSRLEDLPAAAAALEVVTQLDPEARGDGEALAEVYEASGPEQLRQAVERRHALLARATDKEAIVRQLRALRRMYYSAALYDRVFWVCGALTVLEEADAKEREFYQRLAAGAVPLAQAALTEELWQKVVYDPAEERRLSLVFSCVAPIVAGSRAQEPRALGLREKNRLAAGAEASPITRAFELGCGVFNLPLPALYAHPELQGPLDFANVRDAAGPVPAFAVRPDLLAARPEKELLFLVGRALCLVRFDHLVVWPQVVSSSQELRALAGAALKVGHTGVTVPGEDHPSFPQLLALLQRLLPVQALEPLSSVAPWMAEHLGGLDLETWLAAVARTASHAGLLLCGDLGAAVRVLRELGGPGAGALIDDLLRWSVSDAHLGLREMLGLGVVPPDWQPHAPPPEPRIIQR